MVDSTQLATWQANQYQVRAIWLKNATGSKVGCYLLRAAVLQTANSNSKNSKLVLVDVEFRPHQRNKELHIEQFCQDGTFALNNIPCQITTGLAALVELYLDSPELLQLSKHIFASVKDYGTFFFSKAPFPKRLAEAHHDQFYNYPRQELESWLANNPTIRKQLNYQL